MSNKVGGGTTFHIPHMYEHLLKMFIRLCAMHQYGTGSVCIISGASQLDRY